MPYIGTLKSLAYLSKELGRPIVWINGVQKRFGLPSPEHYPETYAEFLRRIIYLRTLGVSEESLRELWQIERKLMEILNLDTRTSPISFLDACAVPADPDRRLLLSNIDLGVDLSGGNLQIGLNFATSNPELFARREMGEDAMKLLCEYNKQLLGIRAAVGEEASLLRKALKWAKGISFGKVISSASEEG